MFEKRVGRLNTVSRVDWKV